MPEGSLNLPIPMLPGRLGGRWEVHLRKLVLECQARPCRRFTVAHRLLRRDGVFLNDAWYCSSGCLEDALRVRLRIAAYGCVEPLRRPGRIPFRLLLVDRGVLSQELLLEALRMQAVQGGWLEDILVRNGFADEAQIASAKAAEHGCPVLLHPPPTSPEFVLPAGLEKRYRARIVYGTRRCALIGFTHGIAPVLLRAVESITGTRTEFCFIPAGSLREREAVQDAPFLRAIPAEQGMTKRKEAFSVTEAAQQIVQCAIDQGSERARIATGDRWAWVRLSAETHQDLYVPLFPGSAPADA
jgi:hypothetical protein